MAKLTPDWFGDALPRGGAILLLQRTGGALMAIRQFATDQAVAQTRLLGRQSAFPLRIPHHSVTDHGLIADLHDAKGGALVLDELPDFSWNAIQTLALSPTLRRREAALFGFAYTSKTDPTENAKALAAADMAARDFGLPLFVRDDSTGELVEQHVVGVLDTPTAPDVLADLAKINAHRRRLHMPPLDPAVAGWTDDDVRLEAQRLERMGNPCVQAELRHDLLAWKAI